MRVVERDRTGDRMAMQVRERPILLDRAVPLPEHLPILIRSGVGTVPAQLDSRDAPARGPAELELERLKGRHVRAGPSECERAVPARSAGERELPRKCLARSLKRER